MKRLGITTKIWLSIGIFVVGFIVSIALGQVQGLRQEEILQTTSEGLFPAAQNSQEAQAAFHRAVREFRNAVLTQDEPALTIAEKEGRHAAGYLRTVAAIQGLSAQDYAQTARLVVTLEKFLVDAQNIYGKVVADPENMTPESQQQVRDLASRIETINASLQERKQSFSSDLHAQLSAVRKQSAQQRWVDLIVFATTLLIAAIIVNLTIRRSITGPLLRANQALTDAKNKAEETSRAKGEFLANMSHEIRTPMNGVLGMTELALDTELTEEQRTYLTAVQSSGEALLVIINDILDFSKIEAGKLNLESIDFNLRERLSDILQTLSVRADQKRLELAFDIDCNMPFVLIGDPARLGQVILNLVGNAIKFTSQGEVVVRVAQESRNGDQILLHFSVCDTGVGIPLEKQKSIFDAFSQVDGSITRQYGGTGLGLTISQQLVKMMGGRIWVESRVGEGSTFHFTAAFGVSGQSVIALATPAELENIRVLIVDDNLTNRSILEETCKRWGMRTAVAENAYVALKWLHEAREANDLFKLILCDVHMPEIDGFELCERIQDQPELIGSTIMMLSSSGQAADAARCRQLGIKSYLVKPVSQKHLRSAVASVLSGVALQNPTKVLSVAPSKPEGVRDLHILLAEDNVINERVAVNMLRKWGHSVVVAKNGREALAAHAKERFDLILMDVQMPAMGGFEATEIIRKNEEATGEHIPIVAMTAHAMKGDRERCIEAGMDGYLPKPISSKALQEAISSATVPVMA